MKSLFLRLLVSLWIAMALLVGLFAGIHGWAFSAESSSLRRRLSTRSVELRAESALSCARDGLAGCEQRLAPIEPRDLRVAVYRSGALVSGEPIEGARGVEEQARRSADGIAVEVGERELVAVVLRRDPSFAAVATGPVRSPWMFFIVPETLPLRLLAIVVVTGLVAVILARYLSRPIRILRGATQQMAAGDLSVRVAQQLAGADGETLALGRDMDRMAERIEELLETQRRLLRDVSHELRSPLARLNIALELVRRRSPPDVEPAFDRIERETERLNGMIGELLTLSRLESGRGMERTERVDLTALVEQLVDDAAFEAEQQGCSVELGARDACSLDGSEELLRRAIENVVRNAVRFTEAGTTVRIDLSCAGGLAELRVRDRGPGVPEGTLGDLFKPFYRVDDHRARGTGGTGIGLAITQRAVLLHGGEVEARNAEGGGLEVALRLPVGAD
ncbi:sensor histidine kinase [Sorangium sp. So ce887]|uniref:sensor histidine kinase n=1 Tax=Sorangium sp. So ce887 TaxID=3133324 RepID=UPI003F623BA0